MPTEALPEAPKKNTELLAEALKKKCAVNDVEHEIPNTTVTAVTAAEKAAYKTKAMQRKLKLTLQPRVASATYCNLEYSAHVIPKALVRDLVHVFPGGGLLRPNDNYVNVMIPVLQRAEIPLLSFGSAEEKEKDRLLLKFFEWTTLLKLAIENRDAEAWVDCTDPASGRAHMGTSGSGFSDVEGICQVDTYPTEMAGVCRIMRHPVWGAAVYPSLVFANARWETVKQALDELNGTKEMHPKQIVAPERT